MSSTSPLVAERKKELLDYYANEVGEFSQNADVPATSASPNVDIAGKSANAAMGAFYELPKIELRYRGEDAPPVAFENIRTSIEYLYERADCAEFGLTALLRILYRYEDADVGDDAIREEIEEAAADFIYWLDEPGEESMCFWTENHQVLFHSNQLLAGQWLPDATFSNGESGAWHRKTATERLERWLDWRIRFGFSEWHSNYYYEEDALALTNLIDFAQEETIRAKAKTVLDLLVFHLAVNNHEGVLATPHGRAYASDLLNPTSERVAPILYVHLGRGSYPDAGMTRCGPMLATSSYERPALLETIAEDTPDHLVSRERHSLDVEDAPEYGVDPDEEGNLPFFLGAQVYNHRDVIETARRAIPEKYSLTEHIEEVYEHYRRQEERAGSWERLTYEHDPNSQAMTGADIYVSRTPEFMLSCAQDYRPGKVGFQQHIWQALLGPRTPVYTTHPGTKQLGGRPSYWNGNGVLPSAVAHRSVAVVAYRIEPAAGHPTVTHAYVPRHRFDEWTETDGWVFGRRGDGYVALRSAQATEWRSPDWGPNEAAAEYVRSGLGSDSDELPAFDLVASGTHNVWTCEVGDRERFGSFDSFVDTIVSAEVRETRDSVVYESPSVGTVSYGWEEDLRVNGQRIDVGDHPRFDNPYCTADFGETEFAVEHNGERLTLGADLDQE